MTDEITRNDYSLNDPKTIESIRMEISNASPSAKKRLIERFFLAALGSIPWVGGFISAAASLKIDEGGDRTNNFQTQWLEEHGRKIKELGRTLNNIAERFEKLGEQIDLRIQSEEYLTLVRQSFRVWDEAETEEKRRYVSNLVTNSAGTRVCSDDVVRLFIDWLDHYHESYFAVIREIFKNPESTRYEIWAGLYGETDLPRDDSAEADLFKLLIRDLSTGGVIRQERETTISGQFVRQRASRQRSRHTSTMESAFEDTKPYVLTELGRQFVHYTMNEVVERIAHGN